MIVETMDQLKAGLKPGERVLGLDVGAKTIGLAVADASLIIASPLDTIRRKKFAEDAEALRALVAEMEIGGFVVGLPVSMDGNEGPACQSVRDFAANLLAKIDIAIAFWDERLSTAAIERLLIGEADMTRARRAEVVDKMAAAYILQGALDSLAD